MRSGFLKTDKMKSNKLSFFQWICCSLIYLTAKRNPKDADLNAMAYFSSLRASNVLLIYTLVCITIFDTSYLKYVLIIIIFLFFWIVDVFLYQNKIDALLSKYNEQSVEKRKRWRMITIAYIAFSILPFIVLVLIWDRRH